MIRCNFIRVFRFSTAKNDIFSTAKNDIFSTALRVVTGVTGAFRTSPAPGLLVGAHEPASFFFPSVYMARLAKAVSAALTKAGRYKVSLFGPMPNIR